MKFLSWDYDANTNRDMAFSAFRRHDIVCIQSVPSNDVKTIRDWFVNHGYFAHIQRQICSFKSPYLITAYNACSGGIAFTRYFNRLVTEPTIPIEVRDSVSDSQEDYIRYVNFGRFHETACLIVRMHGYTVINTVLGDGNPAITEGIRMLLETYSMEKLWSPKSIIIVCGVVFSITKSLRDVQLSTIKYGPDHIGLKVEKISKKPVFAIASGVF